MNEEFVIERCPASQMSGSKSKIGKADANFSEIMKKSMIKMGMHNEKVCIAIDNEVKYTGTPCKQSIQRHAVLVRNGDKFILYRIDFDCPKNDSSWYEFKPNLDLPDEIVQRMREEADYLSSLKNDESKTTASKDNKKTNKDKKIEVAQEDTEMTVADILSSKIDEQDIIEGKEIKKKNKKKQQRADLDEKEPDFDENLAYFDNDDAEVDKMQKAGKFDFEDSDEEMFSTAPQSSSRKLQKGKEKSKNKTAKMQSQDSEDEIDDIESFDDTNLLAQNYKHLMGDKSQGSQAESTRKSTKSRGRRKKRTNHD